MHRIHLERYPGLPPLFLDFARRGSPLYPDPPTIDAALARGRALLENRRPGPLAARAFRFRGAAGRKAAEDLAAGGAVAVLAGHQVGLFTGPLYTLGKAFDAIAIARELTRRGLPAVPVFWALTDDHDLEEVAQTARPGPDGPQRLVLEGADRSNRAPVGPRPIPDGVTAIVDAFRENAQSEEASEILEEFARRSAPGATYGEAFIETLLDLIGEEEPLLVLDPLGDDVSEAARRLFEVARERHAEVAETLRRGSEAVSNAGYLPVVPFRPDLFPFFAIAEGVRRRIEIEDLDRAAEKIGRGGARVSADVLTRPVLKSLVLPTAVSVLGPSEIAYHAQSLPLFPLFGAPVPILVPRTFLVPRGPAERRTASALGIADEDLLDPRAGSGESTPVPQVERIGEVAHRLDDEMDSLGPSLEEIDSTLAGALETARRKATYQIEQLAERVRKAAERKDEVALNRRRRLAAMILPGGEPAERVYPPLAFLLAWGRGVRDAVRNAAGNGGTVVVLDVDGVAESETRKSHAG
ncbi:MAG: bacillithiol biosynthesis cysteine-adding enzyme BshC [Acidobacteriota bacterium]|nr:bacillithiol biosynthesis cysteine-adding enzyme BshC [Acidobacteriota bacterium]